MPTFTPLRGLVAAPFTAFHGDGSLNLALIEKQAASLVANGVTGAFVCGTTGEGVSMTTAERLQVAERWQAVAGSKLRVIVHVGHTALAECRELAAHAQRIGAAGVGCFAPFFFKPANVEDLVAFCAEVAAAAPELPFYYYQIPSMTGVSFPAADFLRTSAGRIPNLAGVKFTFENLMDFAECVRLDGGRYDIVFGRDEMLVAGLSLGARGAIGSTYNFMAPIFNEVIAAFQAGDLAKAQAKQAAANAVIQVFIRFGGLTAGKAIMKMIGLDCGPTRLPLRALSPGREAELRTELERAGFFGLCSRP
jgi:N-acetylneuraminate lyase